MESHDALMTGMFWGGLLVASVPILLSLGIGVYVLHRVHEARGEPSNDEESHTHPRLHP